MRELFEEVLKLQLEHSSENTPEMARRGELIRNLIPQEMRAWEAAKIGAALPFKGRLNVQGRDGTGLKTFVPWVRIHSPELSPSAQNGWYAVYLFHQFGDAVSLCISHGSTRFDGGDFKPRDPLEAAELMKWGRGLIGAEAEALGFDVGIDLGSKERLSKAYERTTAFSKTYKSGAIPPDDELAHHAARAVELVGQLYRATELGRSPDTDPPELTEAKKVIDALARPGAVEVKKSSQGFGLSAEERRLIEAHAMTLGHDWLDKNGYTHIRDVHTNHSCDYLANKEGIEYVVEVKGTTGGFGAVLLTANEVALHSSRYPRNVLIVVHEIELLEMRLKAEGGKVTALEAWSIEDCTLSPLSFRCELKKSLAV